MADSSDSNSSIVSGWMSLLGNRLLLALLAVSLIPLALTGIAMYNSSADAIKTQAFNQLETVRTITAGRPLFMNWADFPAVTALPTGELAAHWLEREAGGRYTYGIRVVRSGDGGATWSKDPVGSAQPSNFTRIAVLPDGKAFVLGERGSLLRWVG